MQLRECSAPQVAESSACQAAGEPIELSSDTQRFAHHWLKHQEINSLTGSQLTLQGPETDQKHQQADEGDLGRGNKLFPQECALILKDKARQDGTCHQCQTLEIQAKRS